jgi:hypothetical protein
MKEETTEIGKPVIGEMMDMSTSNTTSDTLEDEYGLDDISIVTEVCIPLSIFFNPVSMCKSITSLMHFVHVENPSKSEHMDLTFPDKVWLNMWSVRDESWRVNVVGRLLRCVCAIIALMMVVLHCIALQDEYDEGRPLPSREELVARIRDAPCRGEREFEEEYNRTETQRLADEAAFEVRWEEERKVRAYANSFTCHSEHLLHANGRIFLDTCAPLGTDGNAPR